MKNKWFLLSVALALGSLAGTFYIYYSRYDQFPDRMPVHWDLHGNPDGWVAKENALPSLLISPGVMGILLLLTLILPWLSPKKFDIDRFRSTFYYVMALLIALMVYIQVVLVCGMLGATFPLGRMLAGGIFIFFALLGNVLGQIRRNFWMGIRTPWTLASETVWIQTHRVAAWVWTAGGILGAILVFAGIPLLWSFIGMMLFMVLIPVIYSLVLYKRLEREGRFDDNGMTVGEAQESAQSGSR